MPGSSGVPASALTSAPIDGWLVVPARTAPALTKRALFFPMRQRARLVGRTRHGVDAAVHDVGSGRGAGELRGHAGAGGVVRVHVQRHVREALAQRGQQRGRRARLEQAGHVLDGQRVHAVLHQRVGHLHVVVQGVLPRAPRAASAQGRPGIAQGGRPVAARVRTTELRCGLEMSPV